MEAIEIENSNKSNDTTTKLWKIKRDLFLLHYKKDQSLVQNQILSSPF